MDAPQRARRCQRQAPNSPPQAQRGHRQIARPITRELFDQHWHEAPRMRTHIDGVLAEHPELFPPELRHGYALHGFARPSKTLGGLQLRKVKPIGGGNAYHLRPSFALSFMTGTTDALEHPLLLASFGVPCWVLTRVFGHRDMSWHRLLERVGRNSVVGTTVRDPKRLPEHLAADEHHLDWNGQKGYVATTAAEGCLLGVALTAAADEEHLTRASGEFAAEAREVDPADTPQTVNTDGWAATQNAWTAWFPSLAVILCFRHGFLKIRDRSRQHHELHQAVWEVSHAPTATEFRTRMDSFREWFESKSWPGPVREMAAKLWKRTDEYAKAYEHPGCLRTSNAVDRPMNRLSRLVYAGRGVHGDQASSQRRLRGWALLMNFRPFAKRSGVVREHQSPAHRLSGKNYSKNWLENLVISASLMGQHHEPAIR